MSARQIENKLISNQSFGTRVLNSRKYSLTNFVINYSFKLIPITLEELLRANKNKNFCIVQNPVERSLVVFHNDDDHLIEGFLGIYACATPDQRTGGENLRYFYAKRK